MVATVPGSFHSTVHEHTGILESGGKLRHHNRGYCIPRTKNTNNIFQLCNVSLNRNYSDESSVKPDKTHLFLWQDVSAQERYFNFSPLYLPSGNHSSQLKTLMVSFLKMSHLFHPLPRFTSTVPQSQSSPGSSMALPQRSATVMY